jgi:hypothetical protein
MAVETNAAGECSLYIHAGLDVSAMPTCIAVTTTVECQGVTVPWAGTGGATSDTRPWRSPDLNGDCEVDAADSTIFMGTYFTADCRTDFDGSGGPVNLADFAVFQSHYYHACNPTPVPNAANSLVEWQGHVPLVCPDGDGMVLHASIRDNSNQPIEGAPVTPYFDATCPMCVCPPVAGVTDANGLVDIEVYAGLDVTASTVCCSVITTVECMGIQIPWIGTGGATSDTMEWVSPDLDGDCEVDRADSAIFFSDYLTTACRSDFDLDGLVGLSDWITLSMHLGHICDGTPRLEPGYSYAEWRDLACGGAKAFICPDGDGSWIRAHIRDQYNQPMVHVLVGADYTQNCSLCVCSPLSATTSYQGEAKLLIRGGVGVGGATGCTSVPATIRSMSRTLPWLGTPGFMSDTRQWISPDVTRDCQVDAADSMWLAAQMGGTECRVDYNCDSLVNLMDYVIFAPHYTHSCDSTARIEPGFCYAEWRNVSPCGKPIVCPNGDASWIYVVIRDQFNRPMPGLDVTHTLASSCSLCQCQPITDTTNASGVANVTVKACIDQSASPNCCVVTTIVECEGVRIPWTSGAWSETGEMLSFDLNGDCNIDGADTTIFNGDYLTDACRTDYNCDGTVNLIDYADFSLHFGHMCNPAAVRDPEGQALSTRLEQNRPNPFLRSTHIAFSIGSRGRVRMNIYNVRGRHVRTLLDAGLEPGRYDLAWDGRDARGRTVASGVYFYRLEAPDFSVTRRMLLLR